MANSPWVPDGTQPPQPPTVWDDPVSGLVTGATYEPEPLHIDLVEPVEPDISEVRKAVDAALAGEDLMNAGPASPAATIPGPRQPVAFSQPPGIVPPNPRAGWPRTPLTRQPARIQRVRGPRTGASVAVVFAVLVAIGVLVTIVIGIIAGVVNTLTQLFS